MRATALVHGLKVLNIVKDVNTATMSDLVNGVGASMPTISAIVKIFQEHGYLRKVDGGYRLGPAFLLLAGNVLQGHAIRSLARDTLHLLRDVSSETVELSVLENREVLFIDRIESPQDIRLRAQVGYHSPLLYCFSVGRVFMACSMTEAQRYRLYREVSQVRDSLPEKEVYGTGELEHAIRDLRNARTAVPDDQPLGALPKIAPATRNTVSAIEEECARIAEQGWAIDIDEGREGVSRAAAPVFVHSGELAGVLSIAALTFRTPSRKLHAFRDEVVQCARELSAQLGYEAEI